MEVMGAVFFAVFKGVWSFLRLLLGVYGFMTTGLLYLGCCFGFGLWCCWGFGVAGVWFLVLGGRLHWVKWLGFFLVALSVPWWLWSWS